MIYTKKIKSKFKNLNQRLIYSKYKLFKNKYQILKCN